MGTLTSISISLVALAVSAVTLWRTHLAPSRIVATFGPMRMRIHRMKNTGETWWLPHFAVSVGFTNLGTKIGRVQGIRAVVKYISLPIPNAHEIFRCHGEYDAGEYNQHSHRRFEMIENALIGDFVPLIILPKSTVTRFYVFSSRWDRSVRQVKIQVTVEILTDRSKTWIAADDWLFHMGSNMWVALESGSSYGVYPVDSEQPWADIYPDDLHKYTLDSALYVERHEPEPPTTEITGEHENELADEEVK